MLCNGPLSGRQEIVRGNMTEYLFFENYRQVDFNKGLNIKQKKYIKSEYKFGELEIFIWEEDVPLDR